MCQGCQKNSHTLMMNAEDTLENSVMNGKEAHKPLSDEEFDLLRKFIYEHTGISLADHKRALVYSRLAKRLRFHGINSYSAYYELLVDSDPDGNELGEMINAITTNKTDFYRESHHFDFLTEQIIPSIKQQAIATNDKKIRIWSTASSTGQEPYTIAMTVMDSLNDANNWDAKILATDIDTNVLAYAENGVYNQDQSEQLPEDKLQRYFRKSRGGQEGLVMAKPALKSLITFRQLNLLSDPWPIRGPFDVIFCRNVIIYFDKPTQQRLITRLGELLKPKGYLMLGHSEALHSIEHNFEHLGKNIYVLK